MASSTTVTTAPVDSGVTQILRRPPGFVTAVSGPGRSTGPVPSGPAWAALPIFRGMGADVTTALAEAMTPVAFAVGEVVVQQGESGDAMYVLEEGTARVTVRDDTGTATFETVLEPPAVVGEMALVTHEPRTATVVAETPLCGQRVAKSALDDLFVRHPQAAVFLTCLVGERLLETRGIRKVGKYEVMGRLGSGGVATVFEAMHPGLGRSVALKMLSHTLVFDPSFSEHFGREGRLVAQLDHDHIVRVLDTEEAYGTHFIVMEKLTGELLEGIISRGDRLGWSQVRRILAEIAQALAYSHDRGLIHRDIKPSNVFMTEDSRVKLLDFGIAVDAGNSADIDGKIIGTPFYMSPEQISGQQLDGRSDLYSLGIVAYELCTGELPFHADTAMAVFSLHMLEPMPDPQRLDPTIPEDLAEFIATATAKSALDRFASCHEASEFLKREQLEPAQGPVEMSSLTLSYAASQRAQVQQILRETATRLQRLRGLTVFAAHQNSQDPRADTPTAPTARKSLT